MGVSCKDDVIIVIHGMLKEDLELPSTSMYVNVVYRHVI